MSTKMFFFLIFIGGLQTGSALPPLGAGLFGFHKKQRISWLFKFVKEVSARRR
jgi:hypothetical protein